MEEDVAAAMEGFVIVDKNHNVPEKMDSLVPTIDSGDEREIVTVGKFEIISEPEAEPTIEDSDIIIEDDELLNFFHENGLDLHKWCSIFKDAGIATLETIKEDKKKFDRIISHANVREKEVFSDFCLKDNSAIYFSNAELVLEVTKLGLEDANYWIPILKKYFGIRSELGLQCLGPDAYLKINQFSRTINETEVIKKICNVPHKSDFHEWQENMKEKLDIRLEKLKLLYDELGEINVSDSMSDDFIKKIDQYLELMEKNEHGFGKDEKSVDMIHMMYEEVGGTIEYLNEYKSESINQDKIKELVTQCFGGILISESVDDQCKQRKCILKVPNEIELQSPIIPEIMETKIFYTQEDEICFKSSLENLGYSITSLIDSNGFYGRNSDTDCLKKLDEEKVLPVCATDYCIVPVSSCMFDFKCLNFCSDALSKLKILENNLLQPKPRAAAIQKTCDELFSVYGSHINFGRIHFGGIFMLDRKPFEYENCQQENDDLSELKSSVIDISHFQTDNDNEESLKVAVIGGSEKDLVFNPWRHSLRTDSKFWRVVDRGCNLIPIWELLKLRHATEFENVNLLSECLSQGWERYVKIESNIPLFTNTKDMDKEVNYIIKQLELWVTEKDPLSNCENSLSMLMQFKEDLHLRTKDPLAFARLILTHPNMHRYIKSLSALCQNVPIEESRNIHYLMRHIVSDSNYAGVDLSTDTSNETSLSSNVYIIQNFEDYLKRIFNEVQMKFPKEKLDFIPMKEIINSVKNLSCTLTYVFDELSRHNQMYGKLLLILLLMPLEYSYECKLFSHWYHRNAIQYILDNIDSFKKLANYKSDLDIQAFLLQKGIFFANAQINKRKFICDAFKYCLVDRLHPNILELLENHDDFENLNKKLSNLLSGINYLNRFPKKKDYVNDFLNVFDLELEQIEQKYASMFLHNSSELKQGNEKLHCKLRDLGLDEVLSVKFGMKDILTVTRSSLKGEEPQSLKECLLYIISKQVMLDYRFRNIPLSIPSNGLFENSKALQSEKKDKNSENGISIDVDIDEEDELESMLMESIEEPQPNSQNLLHPSDIIVVLMNCCDNILRQIILQKMTVCQLAIPFVLPNFERSEPLLLLWAMRLMNMKWKTESVAKDINPVTYPTPIVSAVRFGDLSRSKSKVLNDIICHQPHDVFFHRDCKAGNFLRNLSNGVVELAWHLPGGKKDDHFDRMMAIANLRGDSKNHLKQFELLNRISSVMLIFLSLQSISDPECSEMLKKLSISNNELVFIFVGTPSNISHQYQKENLNEFKKLMGDKKFKTIFESVKGQVKNADLLSAGLRRQINVCIKSSFGNEGNRELLNFETTADIARSIGIDVDEDHKSCQKGRKLTDVIIDEVESKEITTIKEYVLPLQGHLWSEWSRLSKMQARLDGVEGRDQEAYISELHKKKKICRKEQYKLVKKMTHTMENFITTLTLTKDDQEFRVHFMQWMKLRLDIISNKKLPELQMKYHSLWNDIQEQKMKKLNDTLIRATQNQLDEVEKDLIATSFGLEHFMRELGQVYESIVGGKVDASNDGKQLLYFLPQFAAELLISGFPLEIMDGDACHMPLTWVNAVFDSLRKELGDKRLFVISVLGVQSSGKSTLLNTMFGLNFAVSAGRCTKGVYAQLIPVESNLSKELGYDYILVLDTEGLRAPELGKSKLNHDNELAALVIGLGDVTILNIKGENTAEIEDILQISVHAFLRMRLVQKNLKLQPGCYFVHQNVSAVNATEKMLYGYKKLQEQLDAITIAAAEEENASGIQSFRDVIEFDVKNNVWHFSSLWQGDPPMAPANPSYSERVLDLKTNLLKYPSQKKINCLTFTDLQHRMSDLWNAILYENFVFSFKNSLEVKSYSNLEKRFSQLSWKFRNEIKKWIHGTINEIQSCKEQDITNLHGSSISSLLTFIDEKFSECNSELEDFFSSAKDKEILVQWKCNTILKLQHLSDELKSDAKKTCEKHFDRRIAQFNQERKTESYEQHLQMLAKELVSTNFEEKMSDEALNTMFMEKWNDWIEKINVEQPEPEKDVKGDVLTVLGECFKKDGGLFQKISQSDSNCNIDVFPIEEEYYASKSNVRDWVSFQAHQLFNGMDTKIFIENFTIGILNNMKDYLYEKKNQDYDKSFIYEICILVQEKIRKFNSKDKNYALQKSYTINLTVHILKNFIPRFQEMHRQYRRKNDQLYMLEVKYKPQLLKIFLGNYFQSMQEKTAANILTSSLEKSTLLSLKRDLPRKIAECFTSSHSESHTKLKLYAKVMRSLGELKSFEKYIEFINDPNTSLENWLKYYIYSYCLDTDGNGNSNLKNAAKEILRTTISSLVNCVHEVKASVNTNGISFQMWLQKYHCITKRTIPLSDKIFNILETQQIKNIEDFEEMIIHGLLDVQRNLEHLFSTWDTVDLDDLDESPHKMIAKNVLGCTKQCPFCKTICLNTIDGHTGVSHSAPLHQPQGIIGTHYLDSQKLVLNSCNVDVAGDTSFRDYATKYEWHKFKEYKTVNEYYASWSISPDASLEASAYWKWVFAQFSTKFAEYYKHNCPDIPPSWYEITWDEAEKSISNSCYT